MRRPNGRFGVFQVLRADTGTPIVAHRRRPLPGGRQRSGRRDQSGIDRQSLRFFVKQDLRTIFKSLLLRIHMY